eukprot:GHVH01006837.1.p1 GENE.GHVH01006837.1~~GHVH01006837.1.p1  ORF type:complete len:224 (+),score=18.96 GHVH01006837.1:4-675(+)
MDEPCYIRTMDNDLTVGIFKGNEAKTVRNVIKVTHVATRVMGALSGVLLMIQTTVEMRALYLSAYERYADLDYISQILGSITVLQINWYFGLLQICLISPMLYWYTIHTIMPLYKHRSVKCWVSWISFGLSLDSPYVKHHFRVLYAICVSCLSVGAVLQTFCYLFLELVSLENRLRVSERLVEMEVDDITHDAERNQFQLAQKILNSKGNSGVRSINIDGDGQ